VITLVRMEIIEHQNNHGRVAEILSDRVLITELQDAIDLIGDLYYQGFDHIVLKENNLNPLFFDLKSQFAGDVLQKFSNYKMGLSILVSSLQTDSQALNDFIRESNKIGHINFISSI